MTVSGGATRLATPKVLRYLHESRRQVCALLAVLAIGAGLSACQTTPPPKPAPVAQAAPPVQQAPTPPPQVEKPNYFRLRHTPPDAAPVRVALLLPFTHPAAATRALADAMEQAAELALFDSGKKNIILMPRDDAGSPDRAAAAAAAAIDDGAEIILGPLFAQAVSAVAPVARAHNIPVIAFSTNRAVGGHGVYLLSFQPESEVRRIVGYAARLGHNSFAALVPQTAYGDVVAGAFRQAVPAAGGTIADIERFPEQPDSVSPAARAVANSHADAVLIGEGGIMLRAIAPALAVNGASNETVQLLGTGLWDDPTVRREPMLINGWFAAPPPGAWQRFLIHYRAVFPNTNPPRIATLPYDAMSLVALLSGGQPFHRYTAAALTDPNGFSGVGGIFRFRADGAADRGLAVLQVSTDGFKVIDPAPKSFQGAGF